MEPIRAAIEKARRERGNRNSRSGPSFSDDTKSVRPIEYTESYKHPVSRQELIRNRIIAQEKKHSFADAYRMIRTQVLSKLRENNWCSIGVTSAGPHQGKSLTASNLAISISRNVNHTVLLADFDLRRPNIRNLFNYEREFGLIDCIRDGMPIQDVLFTPSIDGLVVLPGGMPVDDSSELLGTARTKNLIQEMKLRYKNRIVIFDLPPLLVTDDVSEIMPSLDAMILVVEEGNTKREQVKRCMELLKDQNVLGTILNKSKDKLSSYGYNTPYY